MKLDRTQIVPNLKQNKNTILYQTKGKVWSVFDFTKTNLKLLASNESHIIKDNFTLLSTKIPKDLTWPLTSAQQLKDKSGVEFKVQGIGSRSAYWKQKQYKFKGCRPFIDLYFPHEKLEFGSTVMVTEKIQFGVLSAENVMREILAFVFFKVNKLDILHQPIAVFEYQAKGKTIGFCLVCSTPTETRLEQKEDCFGLTLKELIRVRFQEQKLKKRYLPLETNFRSISQQKYSKYKSQLLVEMNFLGGFRGFLNSNLGNDIYLKHKLYICDFDTFKIVKIPKKPDYQFIKNFCLWSLLELLKSSPTILDYLKVDGLNQKQISNLLWSSYSTNSTLWKQYQEQFYLRAKDRNWDIALIDRAFDEIRSYKLFSEVILDNVLNSKIVKNTYKPELSFYVPHNYS